MNMFDNMGELFHNNSVMTVLYALHWNLCYAFKLVGQVVLFMWSY